MSQPPRTYTGLAIAIVVGALLVSAATLASSVGREAAVTSTRTVTITQTVTSTTQITIQGSSAPAFSPINATFVSRFCSNSTAIQKEGSQASALQPSGSLFIGFDHVTTGWKNVGASSLSVGAVCIDAAGVVPANETSEILGATANTIELVVSPSGPIQPGQEANVSAEFVGGSGTYYYPQGGVGIVVIASDGSSASERGPEGVGYITTGTLVPSAASIGSVALAGGASPVLHAVLAFNSSRYPVAMVDVWINGTYVGTIPTAQISGGVFTWNIGIDEPGRIAIVPGHTYSVSFNAATAGYELDVSVATTALAGQ